MSSFDPYDWDSFYFGNVDREEAHRLLMGDTSTLGSFLLRDSSTQGGYSLSVREGLDKIRHYLIERIELEDGRTNVKIADQQFVDIPTLLNHYKMRILDSVSLSKPVIKRCLEKVIGLYKFEGERISDLPFERGEMLEVIAKTEPEWWKARNALNCTGLIPANYVQPYSEGDRLSQPHMHTSGSASSLSSDKRYSTNSATSEASENGLTAPVNGSLNGQIRVPALVRVILDRQPSAYDSDSLRLSKGDFIQLTKIEPSGLCEGTLNGKRGKFPFTYVEFVKETSITAS